MHVIDPAKRSPERANAPIFQGEVHTINLVDGQQGARQLRLLTVTFAPGARTRWHYHTHEQVLLITEGRGIVADEYEEHHVTPGQVVYVSPQEKHWHGGEHDHAMTHISINGPGDTIIAD